VYVHKYLYVSIILCTVINEVNTVVVEQASSPPNHIDEKSSSNDSPIVPSPIVQQP